MKEYNARMLKMLIALGEKQSAEVNAHLDIVKRIIKSTEGGDNLKKSRDTTGMPKGGVLHVLTHPTVRNIKKLFGKHHRHRC